MVTGTARPPQQGVSNPAALSGMAAPAQTPGPIEPQKRVASEHRRSNKPIMEKRRRARINNCLNELKTLILDAMKKDPARHSKLEKADILEMTVKHLETLQRSGAACGAGGGEPPSAPPADRFRAGFRECAAEVGRFPGLEPALRRRLLRHLDACVAPARPRLLPTPPAEPEEPPAAIFLGGGVRLVPTRLANGDLALVLPSPAPPTLGPIPPRTPSTGSASSGCSLASPGRCYSPVSSVAWSPSPPPCSPPPPPPPQPAPLALVTRRDNSSDGEDAPWRPW